MTAFVSNPMQTRFSAFGTEPVSAEARFYCRVRSTWPASRGFEVKAAESERPRIGVCNKCRHRAELLLSESVCGSCRDRLDGAFAHLAVTDWILVAPYTGPSLMELLKQSLAIAVKQPPSSRAVPGDRVDRKPDIRGFMMRHTSFAEMRARWVSGETADLTGRPAGSEDLAELKCRWAPWPSFFRPATGEEIAAQEHTLRSNQCYGEMEVIWEKWGFDDVGDPLDGVWNDAVRERSRRANEEIRVRLQELNLLDLFE